MLPHSHAATLPHSHHIIDSVTQASGSHSHISAPPTPPDSSSLPPPNSNQLSPYDLITSTLLLQPPPQIALIPENLVFVHHALQHLTQEDIRHCVCHKHDATPLSLHFRAAYRNNDNQLLLDHLLSLELPKPLEEQLLELAQQPP